MAVNVVTLIVDHTIIKRSTVADEMADIFKEHWS